jgi:hypothetical protein
MNYTKIYNQLIERARNRKPEKDGYYERHHIIPKCMGGSNDIDNLVKLTYREHFIAHWLLHRETPDNKSLAAGFHIMAFGKNMGRAIKERGNDWMPSSRQLEEARIATVSIPHSEETLKKIREANLGRKHSGETKQKIREANLARKYKYTDEDLKTKQKIREANLGKKWITNGIDNRMVHPDEELPIGWRYGIKHTEEGLKKMREGARDNSGKLHSEETKQKIGKANLGNTYGLGKKWITNGNDTRQINPDEELPIGWSYGRTKFNITNNKKWW